MMETDKKSLRREFLAERRKLTPDFRHEADRSINSVLAALPEARQGRCIGAYISDGTEPDLAEFLNQCLAAGQKIYLPRYDGSAYEMVEIHDLSSDLTSGKYGLLEPRAGLAASACPDGMVWLIPGVVFDRAGGRLGRGKGIYDRLLNGATGPKIGIFYSIQEYRSIPCEEHDIPLDIVVTEREIIRF